MRYNINVFKLDKEAKLPKRNLETDAGLDIFALNDTFIPVGESIKVNSGFAIQIPEGSMGRIEGRSSMNIKGLITANGIIDAGYSGDLSIVIHNFSNRESLDPVLHRIGYQIKKGHKIAQIVVQRVDLSEVHEVTEIWSSKRSNAGFGSSGK